MKAEKLEKMKAQDKSVPARALDFGRKKNKKAKKDKKDKKGKSTGKQVRVLIFIIFYDIFYFS